MSVQKPGDDDEQDKPTPRAGGASKSVNEASKIVGDAVLEHLKMSLPDLDRTLSDAAWESLKPISDALIGLRRTTGWAADQLIANPGLMAALRGVFSTPLSDRQVFTATPAEPSAYSPEMTSASSYFENDEVVVNSFKGLNDAVTALIKKHPNIELVWRGQQNAAWGAHSSLFRQLAQINGVKPPSDNPTGAQPYPTENQMVSAEEAILAAARDEWRLDGTPGLELLARLQHFGAPTRLMDVTRNPYVASWFAVERAANLEEADARLFAIGTRAVAKTDEDEVPDTALRLDEVGSLRMPFWHLLKDKESRQSADWGTGAKRRVWIPPAYEQRITAQNAGFIVDGVPIVTAQTAPYFKKTRGNANPDGYWSGSDLLAASSIYMKTARHTYKVQANRANLAPTFTFLISAAAKTEIREVLEKRFSYNAQTIYPDIQGLSRYLKENLAEIIS
jgi:hypothetical protein